MDKHNKYDIAIGLFYAIGLFLGIGVFVCGGLLTMSSTGWRVSLVAGITVFFVMGLLAHAIITLTRKDS